MNIALVVLSIAESLFALASKERDRAKQRSEWTPEDEQKFAEGSERIMAQPHWRRID